MTEGNIRSLTTALGQINAAKLFLSDLRDSGAIEQDADLVVLLHRPEEAVGDRHEVEVSIAKARNGPVGKFKLTFVKPWTKFENHGAI